MRRILSVTIVLLLAASLVSIFFLPGMRVQDWLLRKYQSELPSVADQQLPDHLQQMVELSDDGLAATVRLLAHPKGTVVEATGRVLKQELSQWRLLPAEQATPKAKLLARCLAEETKTFSPRGRRIAGDLASKLLSWPMGNDGSEVGILEHCETVLRIAATTPEEPRPQPVAVRRAYAETPRFEPTVAPFLTQLPGHELPLEIVALPAPPRLTSEPEAVAVSESQPRLLSPPEELRVIPSEPAADPTDLPEYSPTDPLEKLEPLAIMRRLHAENPAVIAAAEAELKRRQFTALEIALARRLTDAGAEVRRKLALELPRLPVDARPWLLWLSDDPNSGVRLAAATVMATSNDPAIQRRLRELGWSAEDLRTAWRRTKQ